MDIVSDRWYRSFTLALTIIAALTLTGSTLTLFAAQLRPYADDFGLSYTTLGLAAAFLLARISVYKVIRRRVGAMPAALVMTLLFMLNLASLAQAAELRTWYHLLWIGLVFMGGLFGTMAMVGFCFTALLYFLLTSAVAPGAPFFAATDMLAAGGVFMAGGLSYLVWGRIYTSNRQDARISKLSGQLKDTRLQAETLIHSITDGLIVINTDGQVSLVNPAAAKMTGWSPDEAIGIDVRDVINLQYENGQDLPDDKNPLTTVFSQHKPETHVLRLVSRAGAVAVVSLVISPVVKPDSQAASGAVAVLRDVSAARAEEQKRADFISTASHEMRTPVAAIEGYLALALNDQVSKIDSAARGYLEKAHESTQQLGKLFQDLLTSARAEDGRLANHPEVVELGDWLEKLTEDLRFAAEKKKLLVDFVIGSQSDRAQSGKVVKPLYFVYADPGRLREATTNLFDNAVKYTESGKITLGLTGDSNVVQIYVKDTGPGIPAEDIPHLFQKFYRVDSSATRTIGGTGLGLFICRKIIELCGGRIWVESELGQGSTFYINLPRLDRQKASQLTTEPEPLGPPPPPL